MIDEPLRVVGGGRRDYDDDPHVLAHRPTPVQIAQVEQLSQNGVPQRAIAAIIGVAVHTLRKHYAQQLVVGMAKVQAAISQTLLREALGGPAQYDAQGNMTRAEVRPDRILLMFLGKVHCGFWQGSYGGQPPSEGENQDDGIEFNTAGITDGERSGRVLAILNVARARRAGRALDGASPLGGVPEQPAKPGPGERS